ncbi:hypothetical protein ACKW6Q_02275 [Chryseobacterium kwangjuense]|uniref:Virulence-protein E N-terminal domain-containing protein n=1 Tax=Chryseobacterium kwangjuense TaxID=267125 RepID=A0ABW9JXG0_9FLAO
MINKIDYCTNRTITHSFQDINEIVEFIKNPPQEHKKLVEYARTLERGTNEYQNIKKYQLPAISINFNFSNNYIIGKNVAESTGYLYIDVDGKTEQDLEINTAYVCAYWRSLSNTGMTLVVKVEGLIPLNFKQATREIAMLLDIPYDKQAVSIDRLTVLPYDQNAYYNDNVEVFSVTEMFPEHSHDNKEAIKDGKSTHFNSIRYNSIGYDCNGYKLRFNNLDEILESYEIVFDENGFYDLGKDSKIEYAQVFVPFRKILSGERESKLKSIAYQLVALNKNVKKKTLLKYLNTINYAKITPPLDNKEVVGTFEKVYKKIDEIKPYNNASRRFIYDKDRKLTTKEKRKFNIKQICKDKITKTKSDLLAVMKNWNYNLYGKITIQKIVELTGKNKKTVQKYYADLKRYISTIPVWEEEKRTKNKIFKMFVLKNPLLKKLDELMR